MQTVPTNAPSRGRGASVRRSSAASATAVPTSATAPVTRTPSVAITGCDSWL